MCYSFFSFECCRLVPSKDSRWNRNLDFDRDFLRASATCLSSLIAKIDIVLLYGELNPKTPKCGIYANSFTLAYFIAKNEGFISGLQKGLFPAYFYQILLNGTRFGCYDPIRLNTYSLIKNDSIDIDPLGMTLSMIFSGAVSGVLGAFLASPLYLIKTRMQSYSPILSVGHQHDYVSKGVWNALSLIYQKEGIKGLWRGADTSMMRTGVGSAVQLTSYDLAKQALLKTGLFIDSAAIYLHFSASLLTSFMVCIVMNPLDVASTRMYNQFSSKDGKKGVLYKNGMDCILKTVKIEGLGALYKGFTAQYVRLGPHTVLTFVFLEQLKLIM